MYMMQKSVHANLNGSLKSIWLRKNVRYYISFYFGSWLGAGGERLVLQKIFCLIFVLLSAFSIPSRFRQRQKLAYKTFNSGLIRGLKIGLSSLSVSTEAIHVTYKLEIEQTVFHVYWYSRLDILSSEERSGCNAIECFCKMQAIPTHIRLRI